MSDVRPVPAPDGAASSWVLRWTRALPPGRKALDVACGSGRHVRALLAQGHDVTGVDRDAAALARLPAAARPLQADLEGGPWPLGSETFDIVVVTHYLWRPLFPALIRSVAPGGWLIYETFSTGHARLGRPSNPDFLLRPGELLDAVAGHLDVVGFEQGRLEDPPREVQRIAAWRRPHPGAAEAPALAP